MKQPDGRRGNSMAYEKMITGTKALGKDKFVHRLAKESGVKLADVRSVLKVMPDILIEYITDDYRIDICTGVRVYGVPRIKGNNQYYNINTGEIKTMNKSIYPKCMFSDRFRVKLDYINKEKKGLRKHDKD